MKIWFCYILIENCTFPRYQDIYLWSLQKCMRSTKNLSLRIHLIQFLQIGHEFMTLSCDDLKLYLRSTYINNWYLQKYFRSKRNVSNKTCPFQIPTRVNQKKYVLPILKENHTLCGHGYKTGICSGTSGPIKYAQ